MTGRQSDVKLALLPVCPGGSYAKKSPSNPHKSPPFEISTSQKGEEKLSADMRVCVNLNVGFKELAIEKTSTETQAVNARC